VTSANARMITLVRESKAMSQSELAAAAGITQGYLSKAENGLTELNGDRLRAVAEALGCPPQLLTNDDPQRGMEVSCMFHRRRRRRSRMTVAATRKIEALSHFTRITVDSLLGGVDVGTDIELTRMDIDDYEGDPELVAKTARSLWRIPSGPIDNLHALLDNLGVIIVIREFDSVAQDAFSTWPKGKAPLMIVRSGMSADRERFTIAHELGHMLMHVFPNDDQEQQADAFAAEFLAPGEELRPLLDKLTTRDFNRLMGLKAQWRISIAALIQRAKALGVITDRQFREFRIKLSQLGWNTVEPIDIPQHRATLLDSILELHRTEHQYTTVELAELAYMTPQAFQRYYGRQTVPTSLKVVR
jgi:Zn-dependent peptidase ImmA (M78 family)/DNA-binding XRE family transcriptional regulator